ncbi:helix-turn-helix transcriptional regulator [Kribbella deserti]|uniref:AraC family transcriptional regulator n=1 Tax=Kribbella deserti TaxID=1926257 RepID=A0ABV6QE88_9ACTN
MSQLLRFELSALGRPYHAARVRFGPRSRDSDLHGHADFHELMGVVAGSGEHLLDTGTEPLAAGDVVLVRPRDRHAFAGTGVEGLEFINVAFPSSAWHGFLDLTRANPGRSWDSARGPVTFRTQDGRAVLAVFERVLERFGRGPGVFDLLQFWIDLLPLVSPEEVPSPASLERPAPDWLAKACTAMRHEVNLRGGVPRLQELAAVSPAHLARTMRTSYGLTPTAFVMDLRLEHAGALLATTTETVSAIAVRCGFSSQSYFTRCFVAAHALSPSAFRRRAQRAFVP